MKIIGLVLSFLLSWHDLCQKSGRRNENGKTIIEYSEVPIKILREWIKKRMRLVALVTCNS